jgi:hypothetical protein
VLGKQRTNDKLMYQEYKRDPTHSGHTQSDTEADDMEYLPEYIQRRIESQEAMLGSSQTVYIYLLSGSGPRDTPFFNTPILCPERNGHFLQKEKVRSGYNNSQEQTVC